MQLFDLVRTMFQNPKGYAEIKNVDKAKNMFMINRFFAIKFPTTAHALNRNGINPWAVVDLWQIVAKRFNRVPGWIWTKAKKTAKDKKAWTPDPELALLWMRTHDLGQRDLDDAIKFNEAEMKKIFADMKKRTVNSVRK